jgi:hypothetical protein
MDQSNDAVSNQSTPKSKSFRYLQSLLLLLLVISFGVINPLVNSTFFSLNLFFINNKKFLYKLHISFSFEALIFFIE